MPGGMDMATIMQVADKVLKALRDEKVVVGIQKATSDLEAQATKLTESSDRGIAALSETSKNMSDDEIVPAVAQFFKQEVEAVNETLRALMKGAQEIIASLPAELSPEASSYLAMADGAMATMWAPIAGDLEKLAVTNRAQFCSKMGPVMSHEKGIPSAVKVLEEGLPKLNSTKAMLPMAGMLLANTAGDVMPTVQKVGDEAIDAAYKITAALARTARGFRDRVGTEIIDQRLHCRSRAASLQLGGSIVAMLTALASMWMCL